MAQLSPTLFFGSDAEESATRATLHTEAAAEAAALKRVPAQDLQKALDRSEELITALQRHAAFLKVRTLENTQDQAAREARSQVEADRSVLEGAMDARVRQLSPKEVDGLDRYRRLAQNADRVAGHAMSPEAERYRDGVVAPTLQALGAAYDQVDDHLVRPKGLASTDQATRRAALASWNEEYDRAAPEEAAMLGAIVELENRDAVAQGYHDAAARAYAERGLSDAVVQKTLQAVMAHAGAYRRYEQVIAAHTAKELGVTQALSTEAELAATKVPPIPMVEARRLILSSFGPLGPDYTKRFAALVDPANGRLDLAGGAHRARAGTSIDSYDAPTALYYSGYDGSLRDVSKIAHEGGHAIHHELMNAGGGPVYQRLGPNFFSEGFAIFNELLLLEHAADVAKTSAEKENALEALLHKVALELFVSAEETEFERSLYTQAIGGPMLDRAKVDLLYRESIAPYETWPAGDIDQSREWMRKSLVFEDPLYLVNYLYASMIAVALYEDSHTDPGFAAKYEAVLRRGFDVEPEAILNSMGIRLDDPRTVAAAANLLERNTAKLETLYAAH